MSPIAVFVYRMKRVGIDVKLIGNLPWIYINEINGKIVTEKYQGDHGFTLALGSIREAGKTKFTNISKIFNLIRKYRKYEKCKS